MYFIIRNCSVRNAGAGIYDAGIRLENSSNGTLFKNNCSNNGGSGIRLYNNCYNNTIINNTANNNAYLGIGIYGIDGNPSSLCVDNIVENNIANDNDLHGIVVAYYCQNTTIVDNECSFNGQYGIFLDLSCRYNYIINNTANNNGVTGGYAGIYLSDRCDENNITGNTANDNTQFGIYLYDHCDNNNISENTINGNEDYGIYLYSNCDDNVNKSNTINRNTVGIFLRQSDTNTISENTLIDNELCIYELYSFGNIIENNDCSPSTLQEPIFIDDSLTGPGAHNWTWAKSQSWCSGSGTDWDPYIIENHKISGFGTEKGIEILNSNISFIIQDCLIYNSNTGIYLYNVNNSRLINNNCSNIDLGINLDDSNNNTLSGNTVNNNGDSGISIEDDSNNNTISGNTANDNIYYGIKIEASNNNTFSENILYNNTIGVYIDNSDDNSIYENFFLKNGKHAEDYGTDNKWNSTSIGNYWDNWTSPDVSPNDGIVDLPYNISGSAGSKDYLPIAEDGAPSITINSPTSSDVFGVTAPSFDVIITDDYLDSMWYTIDGGINNYTFIENGIINQSAWNAMSNGAVTLTFYASDIFSNIGIAEVSVIKDTTDPIIIIHSPTDGEVFGNNAPLFNITVTENNLDVMWYSFDGGVSTYVITNNTVFNQTAWAALTEGDVTITFYARDLAGNEASEAVTVVKTAAGLDPGIIIIIVVVSVAGGVALAAVIYIYIKKRASPK